MGSSILLKVSPLLAEGVRVRPISELQSGGSREEKGTKEFGTVRGGRATVHLQGVWAEAHVLGYDESRCTHLVRLEAGKELFSVRLILVRGPSKSFVVVFSFLPTCYNSYCYTHPFVPGAPRLWLLPCPPPFSDLTTWIVLVSFS